MAASDYPLPPLGKAPERSSLGLPYGAADPVHAEDAGVREKESDEHHLHHLLLAGAFLGLFLGPVPGLQPWACGSAGLSR